MQNKFILVAKREFLKTIKQPTFWVATLFFPLFMVVIGVVSGYSSKVAEDQMKADIANVTEILVIDNSGLINQNAVRPPLKMATDKNAAIDDVKNQKADALIIYPSDIATNPSIEIYQQDKGIFNNTRYDSLAQELLKQNILSQLNDPKKIVAYNINPEFNITSYKDGVVNNIGLESFAVPVIALIIYFVLVMFSSSYLLMSVGEEKENRIMETLLSIMKPRDLILGKIIGQLSVSIMQILVLVTLTAIPAYIFRTSLPIDITQLQINVSQILPSIFYTLAGFFILANIMVGVGSAVPSYKEAGGLTSVFMIMSILPVYFITIIFTQPNGLVAMIASYFPFTAPMVLLIRSALGELKPLEVLISIVVLSIYVAISFLVAFRIFEIGALEYSKKISLSSLFNRSK